MTEFITSDLHIGHANIWKPEYANRPVSSTEEHDEFLISNWNEIVRPEDFVYVLGDVCMGKIAESLPRLGSLNGTKILVFGNHDRMFHPKNAAHLAGLPPERVYSISIEAVPGKDSNTYQPYR
jgi:calcineurin-like phosphoesterase family protein